MVGKTGPSCRGRGVRGHSGDKAIGGKGHGGVYTVGQVAVWRRDGKSLIDLVEFADTMCLLIAGGTETLVTEPCSSPVFRVLAA